MNFIQNIHGVKISKHKLSSRIININFEDDFRQQSGSLQLAEEEGE